MPDQMMDSEDTMQAQTGANEDANTPGPGDNDEAVSVFLPKEAFGDRPPKIGDSLKDFKIVDVDPETGEAEARCTYDDQDGGESEGGMAEDFDKAMPAESEGY